MLQQSCARQHWDATVSQTGNNDTYNINFVYFNYASYLAINMNYKNKNGNW